MCFDNQVMHSLRIQFLIKHKLRLLCTKLKSLSPHPLNKYEVSGSANVKESEMLYLNTGQKYV